MEHKEYKRLKDTDTVVLFIHGIVGTPNHFEELVTLVPEQVSVYNVLLDGHGRKVRDFSRSSMKKWESQIAATVEELSSAYKEIYIVAHSMGTLLAMEQAIKNKKITKLFLLAVPLRVSLKFKIVINALKVCFDRIKPDDYETLAAKKCYGIENEKNLLKYIGWIPRFLELFAKIRQTRKAIHLLQTPCAVYQSCKDELVSIKSVKYLKQNPIISVKELKNSGHFYYDKADRSLLLDEFKKLMQ